tara:strand:+ start:354 stop:530 length:177 start_codon:yes stop_codon:yes gene_type:complete
MAKYKFIKDQFGENCSVRYVENGHSYSFVIKGLDYTSNTEYIKYKEWLDAGNTTDPAD